MQQQEQPDYKQGYNLLTWVFGTHAAPLEVFFRKPGTSGERYFRLQAAIALVYFPAFGALCIDPKTEPHEWQLHLAFGAAALFMLFVHKASRPEGGPHVHSLYKGDSWCGYGAEALISLGAGLLVMGLSAPLGTYICFGALALFFNQAVIELRDEATVRQMRDARWEQEQIARRLEEDSHDEEGGDAR